MRISLDRQAVAEDCPDCGASFVVVRGSTYQEGVPCGLYVIALHGHSPDGRIAHLAVALLDPTGARARRSQPRSSSPRGPTGSTASSSRGPSRPGGKKSTSARCSSPTTARRSPHGVRFLSVAEHVIDDLPEVRDYFV